MATDLDDRALQDLLPLVARWTGFHPDAIRPDALRRVARSLAGVDGPGPLLARAADHDPSVIAALAEGITVGETYFFRQPEHFRHLTPDDPRRPARLRGAGRCGPGARGAPPARRRTRSRRRWPSWASRTSR